jgi:ribosomal protein L37AE/L43A
LESIAHNKINKINSAQKEDNVQQRENIQQCDTCGGNSFIIADGIPICGHCGRKYSQKN